jgi:hypothetical protein
MTTLVSPARFAELVREGWVPALVTPRGEPRYDDLVRAGCPLVGLSYSGPYAPGWAVALVKGFLELRASRASLLNAIQCVYALPTYAKQAQVARYLLGLMRLAGKTQLTLGEIEEACLLDLGP